jgi:putative Holliday junction resolvase
MTTTYLGIDYGDKRLGIATGQTLTRTATPLTQLTNDEKIFENLTIIIQKWKPDGLVVGLPLHMDSTPSRQSKKAKKFAKALEMYFKLPVHIIDERLSTREARSRLNESSRQVKKDELNAVAAQIILETFLSEYEA